MSISFRLLPLLALIIFTGCKGGSAGFGPGVKAQDFSVLTLDGKTANLSDFRGSVVLLNFWASWCSPCVAELPAMERLFQRLKNRGFVVVGVGVDDQPEALAQFRQSYGITYPILFDKSYEAKTKYQVSGFPESFVIDRAGNFVMMVDPASNNASVRIVGAREWDSPQMINQFEQLLAK